MPIDNTYTLPKESSRNSALALPPNLETDAPFEPVVVIRNTLPLVTSIKQQAP